MAEEQIIGPRITRRYSWVELPEEYAGFKFKLWVNAPTKLWNQLTEGGDEAEMRAAIRQLIIEHNSWRNFDGEPFPAANSPEFWDEIPTELAALIIVSSQAEIEKLPFSVAATRQRSRRGSRRRTKRA